ncbi:Protein bicaudal D 1 [Liparis tanakae]|uniref:Protein bicaudal D 1 n=1 Tax=Liparis tanakae TaxID=230148 RepID=A0A4Z2GG55_9TELE|nr:Protein bicaudal D 1 [Liparis tanakae]
MAADGVCGASMDQYRAELERLTQELGEANREKVRAAECGLVVLEENQALKQRYADLELDQDILRKELEQLQESNSLHLPLITSLVPHYLHLVLTPFSPAAHSLVSPSLPSPGPHALLTCSPSPHTAKIQKEHTERKEHREDEVLLLTWRVKDSHCSSAAVHGGPKAPSHPEARWVDTKRVTVGGPAFPLSPMTDLLTWHFSPVAEKHKGTCRCPCDGTAIPG